MTITINGESIEGTASINVCDNTIEIDITCSGFTSSVLQALCDSCNGGSDVTCETGGCTYKGSCSNVCCNSCKSSACISGCTAQY